MTSDMLFQIPRLISHVSSIMTLEVRARLRSLPLSRSMLTLRAQHLVSQEGDVVLTGRCRPKGARPAPFHERTDPDPALLSSLALAPAGTPSGVGPIQPGDKITSGLATAAGREIATLSVGVTAREGGYVFSG